MRQSTLLLYFVIVLLSPSLTLVSYAVCATDFSLKTSKVDITQYSKTVRKRSVFDEYSNADRHFKSVGRHSQVKLHLTSPKSGFKDSVDDKTDKRLENQNTHHRSVTDAQYVYQTDSNPPPEMPALDKATYHLMYIGCFSTWEKQYTEIYSYRIPEVNEDLTPESCAEDCRSTHGELFQLQYVKGGLCHCAKIFNFNSSLIDDSHCDIPCPIRAYNPAVPQLLNANNSCGGNLAFSVYCWGPGEGSCDEVQSMINNRRSGMMALNTKNKIEIPHTETKAILLQNCAVCNSHEEICVRIHMYPDFDYFPTNSPQKCVEYCSRSITYIDRNTLTQVRESTPYALVMWWNLGKPISICRCASEEIRQRFVPLLDGSACNMTCPGDTSTFCGGITKDLSHYATVYCVNGLDNGKCQGEAEESTPPEETIDPCDSDLDCDDPETETPTTENQTDHTQETSTTPNETTTETTTTAETTSTLSTTEITEETTTSIPTTSSTFRSTSTTQNPECSITCRKTDRYGAYWEVCTDAGGQGIKPCSYLIKKSLGQAFWKCSKDGTFVTRNPDVSNCSTEWLGDKHDELGNIEDIEGADVFIHELSEACRKAQDPDSDSKYFGHEIRNITTLVDLTVEKAKEFSPPFHMLEQIVATSVDLSAFLIQYHDPWQDLTSKVKSSISTSLIDSTEESLFHLIDANTNETYLQIFTLNTSDVSDFLIFAEHFNKLNSSVRYENYEFPPEEVRNRHDTYIKLPKGWEQVLPNKQVEIAAMSINSKYISYVMPGQYENLGTGVDPELADSKVINGKLISFTMSSTESTDATRRDMKRSHPTVSFKDKGVEIIFQHDIEAWGDETQAVRRKLHEGEKPKAVLGSTQCVYWNVKTLSWSETGCHIVSSSRHETVCECNHLTSFAILMDVHQYVGKEFALELLTLILCPLSLIALVISIILLSSVSGLQRIRATITKNLSICLLIGNTLVIFVLDRNYFDMSEGLCVGAGIVTHYIFLCAFMWMMIEGVQLYRMVVHVFDSGRSYIKHFGIFAYGSPLLVVAATAGTGYLKGDKPYGGDVYCWLEGSYIWSFMAPVAFITMVNLIVLFIALKTAYQLQQNKKLSPTFIMGKVQSYRTWFKGCFSLTVILGLTWVVGFFTLMESPSGIVAAYIFTILNASQGIFIFVFHCFFNDKIRTFTRRNLSTYLPSWLSSSVSSIHGANDASFYGKKPLSSMKSGDSALEDTTKKKSRKIRSSVVPKDPYVISGAKLRDEISVNHHGAHRDRGVTFTEARNYILSSQPAKRCESNGTVSSVDSIPYSIVSESGHVSSDTSQSALVNKPRFSN